MATRYIKHVANVQIENKCIVFAFRIYFHVSVMRKLSSLHLLLSNLFNDSVLFVTYVWSQNIKATQS